jgi:hypothetical protein
MPDASIPVVLFVTKSVTLVGSLGAGKDDVIAVYGYLGRGELTRRSPPSPSSRSVTGSAAFGAEPSRVAASPCVTENGDPARRHRRIEACRPPIALVTAHGATPAETIQ